MINFVLTNMVLYMPSFFQLPKEVLQRLDYFKSKKLGKETVKRKNTGWPNGAWFVGLKTKVALEFMTCRSRMRPFSVNGYLNFLPRMVFGKPCCATSI